MKNIQSSCEGALVQKGLFDSTWGGPRAGAGRKRKRGRRAVEHRRRPRVTRHDPLHVTQRVDCAGNSLRTKQARLVLMRCFSAGGDRFGFRLVEFSIQSNHLHFVAEADTNESLSRGLQGLKVRIARALNRLWELKGTRFPDRYHVRVLGALREVRNVLNYVLNNARHHGHRFPGVDPISSGPTFSGWHFPPPAHTNLCFPLPEPQAWKLTTGWRTHGRLDPNSNPSPQVLA